MSSHSFILLHYTSVHTTLYQRPPHSKKTPLTTVLTNEYPKPFRNHLKHDRRLRRWLLGGKPDLAPGLPGPPSDNHVREPDR
jgi:hypothetical protein